MRAVFVLLFLTGCAGPQLMRCPESAPKSVYICKDKVDGVFYRCDRSGDLRICTKPE